MNIIMSTLSNKHEIFGEDEGSNAEDRFEGKLGDREKTKNQPKKGLEKFKPVQVSWIIHNPCSKWKNMSISSRTKVRLTL